MCSGTSETYICFSLQGLSAKLASHLQDDTEKNVILVAEPQNH